MSGLKPSILVIDDEERLREVLAEVLSDGGLEVHVAGTGREGLAAASNRRFDAVVLDLKLPDISGIDVLRALRQKDLCRVVVMITAYSSVETAIQAMKLGAFDYVTKPFKTEKLRMILVNALAGPGRARSAAAAGPGDGTARPAPEDEERRATEAFGGVVGSTREMAQVFRVLAELAPTNATVLIYGESGTGKEMVARHIHRLSLRAGKPFIVVNCAALPETLLESELFGHEKGAFTGASSRRLGRFELANGGTLFLDEVSELSVAVQAKLLRVTQEKEFERVGGSETIRVDTRIISATNKDLQKAVRDGEFREDLFYRLNVVPITLPPLRDRRRDIPALCEAFIRKHASGLGKPVSGISSAALGILCEYDWPGNIRQLENCIERAIILCRGNELLPEHIRLDRPLSEQLRLLPGHSLEDVERDHIAAVLRETNNNRSEAARRLRITRRTLLNKIRKYDLGANRDLLERRT